MTIEERLARLELQNRWMKRAGAVVFAAVAAVLLVGQGKGKELPDLEVRSLVVKGPEGKVRARLGISHTRRDSFPGLRMFDSDGKTTVTVGGGKVPALALVHRGARVDLAINSNGEPAFTWTRWKEGHVVATWLMLTIFRGAPQLVFQDAKGNVIWQAPGDPLKEGIARTQCKEYYDATKVWRMVQKKYPSDLKEMQAPLKPGDEDFIRVRDDPWGNHYVLEVDGRKIWVISFGPDGIKGTADDIQYPQK